MASKDEAPLLIFDLGNVIAPYDDILLRKNLAKLCTVPNAEDEIPAYFAHDWDALQKGSMQDEELYAKFVQGLGFQGDFRKFQEVWCSHTSHDLQMEELVTALSETYRVVILSNSTRTHWDNFNANYPVLKSMDALYASHLLKAIKPTREVFQKVLALEGRQAKDAIFIDDIERMVIGAREAGLKGIVFQGYDQLVKDLSELGIKIPRKPQARPDSINDSPTNS